MKPQVLTRFEPWMALSFTEGSIGGDIERVDLVQLKAFYGRSDAGVHSIPPIKSEPGTSPAVPRPISQNWAEPEPKGSNGMAIAPANTHDHHALLLINPHTSFFFRSELQVSSDEGLNAYGAVTWGQFFVYQGFNDRAGWMHTSSGVDAVDEFAETVSIVNKPGQERFNAVQYGAEIRPVTVKPVELAYKAADGSRATRTIYARYASHGPIVRGDTSKWIAVKLMNIPVPALEQSYLRTKARTYAEYRKTMELQANSSNNTIFADADGDIAYWHGNYIPRRDTAFDYTKPVDGSNPATDWHGLLSLAETPQLHNPASGYLFNVKRFPLERRGGELAEAEGLPRVCGERD